MHLRRRGHVASIASRTQNRLNKDCKCMERGGSLRAPTYQVFADFIATEFSNAGDREMAKYL
jgi:hypothetical protein